METWSLLMALLPLLLTKLSKNLQNIRGWGEFEIEVHNDTATDKEQRYCSKPKDGVGCMVSSESRTK